MSDKILKALMQLFAIIANAERFSVQGRSIVEYFLKQQLSAVHVQTYLKFFDDYLAFFQGKSEGGKEKKRVSVNSVKVLRICADINAELNQQQKYFVLIRLIEFAYSSGDEISEQEKEFVSTVAESFNISKEEFEACISFATAKNSSAITNSPFFLLINNGDKINLQNAKHLRNETLSGDLWIFNIKSAGLLFARYFGETPLTLNGQPLLKNTSYVFTQGSVIRGPKLSPVYFSDVVRCFWDVATESQIQLTAHNVEYFFKSGKQAIRTTSFVASSGNLVGIMGGSGAGKSTMLNILNSTFTPTSGEVLINGINIHKEKKKTEGLIGYVPQDDLLMENLTVYQNLFFNSKLVFGDWSDEQIEEKANKLLQSMGLYEAKDLKVGDALENIISGGQRKRLNIALELIREPGVLFVDEPTSGLSSRDSENVMDLLKQLSISGKLVFVVIHQPSSDIFKMFDKLLILDIGGYPIYFGNPSDSLIYFKRKANYADADESECGLCGNINPEEVFSIIESRVLDEFGNLTKTRKVSPQEWNNYFIEGNKVDSKGFDFAQPENYTQSDPNNQPGNNSQKETKIENGLFKKPTRLKQLAVFIKRDVISKLRDTQYLLINFLEAPALAMILAYSIKYHEPGADYIFSKNSNLPAYIFMSVIVALFMGLTVSAEEIIRDRKILKRESFLNLSRSSYLISKIAIMFFISLVQTASFVLLGNLVFGIQGMFMPYWLVLFSVSCFSNLVGLNISGAFDSAVTIYILIPFLIIPQMILSGVMVKYDKLNPTITSQTHVPLIGEVMTARWAFEALAVHQFKCNEYERNFFDVNKTLSSATYQKDAWLNKLIDKINQSIKAPAASTDKIALIKNELKREANNINDDNLKTELSKADTQSPEQLKSLLDRLKKFYKWQFNTAAAHKDQLVKSFAEVQLDKLQSDYANESLENEVLRHDQTKNLMIETNHSIIRNMEPVYMDASSNSFIRSQFYVSRKHAFGNYYDTFTVNVIIIWLMTFVLSITLYFNVLVKFLRGVNSVFEKIIRKRKIA